MKPPAKYRRLLVWMFRVTALVVVIWFVHGSLNGAWGELSKHEWHVQPAWIAAAGAIYILALAPMGWFWQQALVALGCSPPLLPTMCGYYLGHIGKYVPGKAMSVILRVAAVRKWVPSMRLALISALLETLTMMAVGACIAAIVSIFVLHMDALVTLAAVGMALASVVPTLPYVARRIAGFRLKRAEDANESERPTAHQTLAPAEIATRLQAIDFRLLTKGWFAGVLCWLLQAISLWATLRAIGADQVSLATDLPSLIAAVSFSVVAGFLSQLPGGLGVRDALLIRLLIPVCGEANALVATVLMRFIWLLSELITCGILYIGVRARPKEAPTPSTDHG